MKTRPLFGICPLFGVSVKREFTVAHSGSQLSIVYDVIVIYYAAEIKCIVIIIIILTLLNHCC